MATNNLFVSLRSSGGPDSGVVYNAPYLPNTHVSRSSTDMKKDLVELLRSMNAVAGEGELRFRRVFVIPGAFLHYLLMAHWQKPPLLDLLWKTQHLLLGTLLSSYPSPHLLIPPHPLHPRNCSPPPFFPTQTFRIISPSLIGSTRLPPSLQPRVGQLSAFLEESQMTSTWSTTTLSRLGARERAYLFGCSGPRG